MQTSTTYSWWIQSLKAHFCGINRGDNWIEKSHLLDILSKITLFKDMDDRELNIFNMPEVYEVFSPGEVIVKVGYLDACF